MGGSSSGQVTGYRHYAKFALFIGNTIENLNAINFDKRGWVTRLSSDNNDIFTIVKPDLFGENEGGVVGTIDVRYGLNNQSVSEAWKKEVPLISTYPCQSYLVFRGIKDGVFGNHNGSGWINAVINSLGAYNSDAFYLGNSGYMKEMLLWPKRIHVRNNGRAQWYDIKADIDSNRIKPEKYQVDAASLKQQIEVKPNKWYVTKINGQTSQVPIGFSLSGGVNVGLGETGSGLSSPIITTKLSGYTISGTVVLKVIINPRYCKGVLTWDGDKELFVVDVGDISNTNNTREIRLIWDYEKRGMEPTIKFTADGFNDGTVTSGADNTVFISYYIYESLPGILNIEGIDINPIHKIREILTDDTAMNKPESSVNDVNFMKAADRIWDEGLGVSWSITEKSCIDAINELCYHIEAGIRVNRQTGLYEMVLFRDNWFAEDEIHTISESKIKSMQYEITNADEVINQVNVNYYDRENIKNSSFSISENGLIQTLGRVNAETLDFPYFMNMRNAEIVANWKLKQLSTGAFKGSFTTGWREARKWNRYDLIRLPWSKRWTGTILVRIMSINLGGPANNEVSIEFIEVVPATGMMNTTIVIDDPIDTKPEAPKPCNTKIFELPYFEAAQAFGEREVNLELSDSPEVGYLCAIAEKPQNNSLNAALHVDSGNGYERVATVNYCETAYLDQAIDRISSIFIVKSVGNIASVRIGSQIFINDEIMVYQSYDAEARILTVKRGALESITQNHSVNSILYFADDFVAVDQTLYVEGEAIDAKVLTTTPSGVLTLGEAVAHEVEFNARAMRPYPPANVKINGAYFPETQIVTNNIVLTWVHRNRVQQTGGQILGWFDGGVTIESGVTYSLELSTVQDGAIHTASNINADTYTIPASMLMQNKAHKLRLWSVRDGFDSYQVFEHSFFVESVSLVLTATVSKDKVIGSTVPTANIAVNVDESLNANMRFDGSSISGKAEAGATITIEIEE